MYLKNRIISVCLILIMLFSLAACENRQGQEETVNYVDPKAVEAYESAVAVYENADSYALTFTVKTKKQVGTEAFNDVHKGSAKYLDLTTDPKAMVSISHNLGTETLYTAESFRNGRTSYSFTDEKYVYQSKESFFGFSERQLPVGLLDPKHYENIAFDSRDPELILFSAAVSPEEWLPGLSEEYACIDFHAEGRVRIKEGNVTELMYNVTYTRGATLYTSVYSVSPQKTEIDAKDLAHDFKDKYAEDIEDITLPYTLRYANAVLNRYEQGMVRIYDEFFRRGSGKTHAEELTVFTCLDENNQPALLATETSLLVSSGKQQSETVRRKQIGGHCSIAEDGEDFSETESDAEFKSLSQHQELKNVSFPSYGQFEKITLSKAGSFILLEGELNYSAGSSCFCRAGELESGDSTLYENAFPRSATCRIAIDTDTGFLTAAQFFTVASPSKTNNDLFAFMRDIYVDPGNYSAYETIFQSPYPDEEPPAEEKPTPLFYKITDKEGHTAYLLGTIHTGDNRTAYLPQSIYDAFNGSDALAVESNLLNFDERLENDEALSEAYTSSMFFTNGNTLESFLHYSDLYQRTERLLFAMGYGLYANNIKPAAAVSVIDNWYSGLFAQLSSEKGVDMRLLHLADEDGKKIYEIEKPKDHYNALTDYSRESQVRMLEEAVDMKKTDAFYSTLYLYQLWCEGDEELLREAVTMTVPEDATPEEKAYYEEYVEKMITRRDKIMVDGICGYLESGETVFVAVGLAHVIGENGIVDQLTAMGYTVTQVN